MEIKRYSITVSKLIHASPTQIWETWTDSDKYVAVHDSHRADIDFRVGGKAEVVYFADKDAGETLVYHEIVPEKKLVYGWQGSEEYRFTLRLTPVGDATDVSIEQDCQDDPQWIDTCLAGWSWILDSLEHYFDTGKGLSGSEWTKTHPQYRVASAEADE